MKSFKIYDEVYELQPTAPDAPDAYAIGNDLVDSPPKAKCVGFVYMEDGSCIQCYKKFNPLPIVIPIVSVLLVSICVGSYFLFFQPKDVAVNVPGEEDPFVIKEGTDTSIITYNGFMAISNDEIDIDFMNGEEECTVTLTIDGVEVDTITLAPHEYLSSVPASFTTEDGIVQGEITISTATSTVTNPIAVEIPSNNMPNGAPSTLDGYWKGEYVYEYIPPQPTESPE